MTIDTLAYSKHLEAAGIDRRVAEAHAEALTKYALPDLVAKTDLAAAKVDLVQELQVIEQRLTLRLIAIVGAFDVALYLLLSFFH